MGRERRRARERESRPVAEVNMTPLMDLTFLLLITFIIAFPAIQQGIDVRLPKGESKKIEQKKAQSVTVKYGGELFFNDKQISHAELESLLEGIAAEDPQPPLLIRCDERVEYGELMKTLQIVNRCKISRMALVTEAL